jgi:hypothetical protein
MADQGYLLLLTGRTVALDLLLRTLYAKWASEQSDPVNFITVTIESIIGSMDAVNHSPQSDAEAHVWEAAERDLRSFLENVALRVREPRT